MILRRYGRNLQSVEIDFDPNAMSEIGFRRDHGFTVPREEFESTHERVTSKELTATTEASVQAEGEAEVLGALEDQLRTMEADLSDGEVLLVENERDDHPKTRDRKKDVIVDGKNRIHFHWRIEPPLRIGVYRRK